MKKIVILTFLLLLPLIIGNNAMAQTRSVIVDGFCYLAGMSDHSGTKVLFYAVSPSAVTDSTFTNEDGSFAIILSVGIYTVHYSHEGWESYTIPGEIAFFEDTTLPDITLYSVDVTIDGFCYLAGVSDHSGTEVLFNAVSLPAFTDSTFTNEDGSFLIEISSGSYTVQYSHKYWESYTIPGEIELVEDTTLTEITLNHDYITVDGFCYLSGMSNHLGTKVLFSGVNPSAVTDSTFTNEDGSFAIILSEGIYTVHYSHEGWESYTIPEEIEFVEDTTLANVTLSLEVIGSQSGIWSTGETYNVIGDISVNTSDTLIIEHGVTIKFMGFYSFTIYGTLFAEGTETDSILFTSGELEPYHNNWDHIKFEGNSSSNSIISYSKVEYATYGICCDASSPSINNNTIINNGRDGENGNPPGDGYGSGIYCTNLACPNIHDNTISNNGGKGGESGDQPMGSGNGYGVYCDNSSPNISNNTIVNNGGNGGESVVYSAAGDGYGSGIYCKNSSCPNINNNIISDNGGEGGDYYYQFLGSKGYGFNIICNNNGNGSESKTPSSGTGNGYGIYCDNSSPNISNNTIIKNGGNAGKSLSWPAEDGYGSGIYCVNLSYPSISDNIISDNGGNGGIGEGYCSGGRGYGFGIYCIDSSPIINNNTINDNAGKGDDANLFHSSNSGYGYGIYCDVSNPQIYNNLLCNNGGTGGDGNYYAIGGDGYGFGIYFKDCLSGNIINNTILNNTGVGGISEELPHNGYGYGYGIRTNSSSPNILNNIVFNNNGEDYGYGIYADSILTTLEYNLFFQNDINGFGVPLYFGVIVTVNANGDSCDTYYNLFVDPQFVDTLNSNYHLYYDSPCIDAGNPDTTGLNLPEFDLDGNPRIYNSIVDMGCYEWQGIGIDDIHISSSDILLYQNYPNPFSTSTTISYNSVPNKHEITRIKIYNLKGQLVKTLLPITNNKLSILRSRASAEDGQITNVIWDGKDENGNPLSNGIYFYQLKTESYNGIKKMIIIR